MSGQRNPGHATQRSSGRNPQYRGKGRFLVPKKDGRQRSVFNLNTFVHTPHFKMEGVHMLKDNSQAMVTKNRSERCVYHDPSSSSGYLRFQNQGKTYQFKCLPFGLSSAPLVFTKTLRPVVTLLRELGLRIVVYIDDVLVMAESEAQLKDHVQCLVYLLENLGYIINYKKISVDTNKTVGVSRVHSGLRLNRAETSNRQGQEDQAGCPEITKAFTHNSTGTISVHREVECGHKGHSSGPCFTEGCRGTSAEPDYEVQCLLSLLAQIELEWWITHLSLWNGRSTWRQIHP